MTPRPRPLWRKVVRWVLIGLGAVVVLVGAALVVLQTPWGKNKVRAELVSQLQKHVRGTVSIGELDGNLFGDVTAHDVDIEGQDRLTHVHIDSLEVDFRLLPLVSRHFHADLIDVQGLTVKALRGKDGRLGLADLWIAGPSTGPPWSVTLQRLSLERAAATIEVSPGRVERVDQLALAAGLEIGGDNTAVELDSLKARWAGPDRRIAARGHLDVGKDGGLEAWDASVELGQSTLSVLRFKRGAGGGLTVALAAHLRAADLRAVMPDTGLRADADLVVMGGRAGADRPIGLALFGTAGRAALAGHLAVTPADQGGTPRGEAQLFWTGVRPAALWTGAPRADVYGWLVAEGAGAMTDLTSARANLRLGLGGTFDERRIDHAALEAHLSDRHARVRLDAQSPLAGAVADVRAILPVTLEDARETEVPSAQLTLRTGDVGRVLTAAGVAGPPAASGPLAVTVRAHGPVGDLSATAHLTSASLRHQDLEATGVVIDLSAQHLPARTSGRAEVQVASLCQGKTRYGSAHLQATLTGGRSARVRFRAGGRAGLAAGGDVSVEVSSAGGATVAIHQLDLTTRGLTWRGGGGHLEVAPGARHVAGNLAVRSAAGSVAVTADIDRTGAAGAAGLRGPVTVRMDHLDLGRVMKTAGLAPGLGLRGTITARGRMMLPDGPGRFDLDAGSIAWKGGPPSVGGHVEAYLQHRRLALRADARAGRLGRVHAEVTLRSPARVTEPAAWRRLGRRAVRSVLIQADQVELAAWSKRLGDSTVRAGTARVAVNVGAALDKGRVALEIKGGRVAVSPSHVVPVEGQLALSLDKRALALFGRDRRGQGRASGGGRRRRAAAPAARPGIVASRRSRAGPGRADPADRPSPRRAQQPGAGDDHPGGRHRRGQRGDPGRGQGRQRAGHGRLAARRSGQAAGLGAGQARHGRRSHPRHAAGQRAGPDPGVGLSQPGGRGRPAHAGRHQQGRAGPRAQVRPRRGRPHRAPAGAPPAGERQRQRQHPAPQRRDRRQRQAARQPGSSVGERTHQRPRPHHRQDPLRPARPDRQLSRRSLAGDRHGAAVARRHPHRQRPRRRGQEPAAGGAPGRQGARAGVPVAAVAQAGRGPDLPRRPAVGQPRRERLAKPARGRRLAAPAQGRGPPVQPVPPAQQPHARRAGQEDPDDHRAPGHLAARQARARCHRRLQPPGGGQLHRPGQRSRSAGHGRQAAGLGQWPGQPHRSGPGPHLADGRPHSPRPHRQAARVQRGRPSPGRRPRRRRVRRTPPASPRARAGRKPARACSRPSA